MNNYGYEQLLREIYFLHKNHDHCTNEFYLHQYCIMEIDYNLLVYVDIEKLDELGNDQAFYLC